MEPIARNKPPMSTGRLIFSAERNVASAAGERLMQACFTEGAD